LTADLDPVADRAGQPHLAQGVRPAREPEAGHVSRSRTPIRRRE